MSRVFRISIFKIMKNKKVKKFEIIEKLINNKYEITSRIFFTHTKISTTFGHSVPVFKSVKFNHFDLKIVSFYMKYST